MSEPTIKNACGVDEAIFNDAKKSFEQSEWVALHADIAVTFEPGDFAMILVFMDSTGKKYKVALSPDDMRRLSENWSRGKAKADMYNGVGGDYE